VQRASRTDNQPSAHRPPCTANTSHLQLCARTSQYFALVYLVRGFPKFNSSAQGKDDSDTDLNDSNQGFYHGSAWVGKRNMMMMSLICSCRNKK
jgi:hypothetical protein